MPPGGSPSSEKWAGPPGWECTSAANLRRCRGRRPPAAPPAQAAGSTVKALRASRGKAAGSRAWWTACALVNGRNPEPAVTVEQHPASLSSGSAAREVGEHRGEDGRGQLGGRCAHRGGSRRTTTAIGGDGPSAF